MAITIIADILAGADQLSVVTDRIEEISTKHVVVLAAHAAASAYQMAAGMLEDGGHTLNAREAYAKAAVEFARAQNKARARYCRARARANYPSNGNIYDP